MKNIHIPTIEELLRPDEFDIKCTRSYKLIGIPYRGQNCNYFLGRRLMLGASHNELAEDARTARPDCYRAPSAPLIYAICKTLYQNREGKHKEHVEQVRAFLCGALDPTFRGTLTRVIYNKTTPDQIIHDYKQKKGYNMYAELIGPQGYITRPETNAAECLQAILDTTDKPDTVNEVFKWLTGLDTFLWRFEQDIQQIERVRTVELGTGNNNAFIISAIGSCNDRRAALAVHPAK